MASEPEEISASSIPLSTSTPKQRAIRTTKLRHYPAAVAEWLHDLSPGKAALRGRFEHGISNASDETLGKAKALVSAVAAALDANDAEGLAVIEEIHNEYFGFKRLNDMLAKAHTLLDSAVVELQTSRQLRASGITERTVIEKSEDGETILFWAVEDVPTDAFIVEFLVTMLGSLDARFRSLDAANTLDVLSSVARPGEIGRGKKTAAGALVELATQCDAFDFRSERDARKVVKNAIAYAKSKTKHKGA